MRMSFKIRKTQIWILDLSKSNDSYIVQELCNFTQGFPWLASWVHDVRLVYINWIFAYSTIRINDNDFRANVSQGWHERPLNISQMPWVLLKLSWEIIDKVWWTSAWVVSFDFWFDANIMSWKLIELNYSPWILPQELLEDREAVDLIYNFYANLFNVRLSLME